MNSLPHQGTGPAKDPSVVSRRVTEFNLLTERQGGVRTRHGAK